jgi:hypothetical protein
MSSNSGEYLPPEPNITPEDLPSKELGTIRESLTDKDNVIRCIGCPLVENCIEKAKDESDPNIYKAHLSYAKDIQDRCQGPNEETSWFLRKSIAVCNSPLVKPLPKRMRKKL